MAKITRTHILRKIISQEMLMCNMKALNIYYFGVMTTDCHFLFYKNMSNVKVNRILTTRRSCHK